MNRKSTSVVNLILTFGAVLAWSLLGLTGDNVRADKPRTVDQDNKQAVADPAAENLLRNPGFEEGDQSPVEWKSGAKIDGVEYLWDHKIGQQGKSSLCLNKTADRYFPIAQWYQIVDREPGSDTLKVTAQARAARASKAIIDVIFLDEKSEWISHEWVSYIGAKKPNDPPATHDWKEYQGTVTIPLKTKKIQVALQIYGPGKVWFDEVRAEYVK